MVQGASFYEALSREELSSTGYYTHTPQQDHCVSVGDSNNINMSNSEKFNRKRNVSGKSVQASGEGARYYSNNSGFENAWDSSIAGNANTPAGPSSPLSVEG